MILVTVNPPKQLLLLTFIGNVRAEEIARGRDELGLLASHLSPGFKLITDLSPLETLDENSSPEIGKAMELCDQKGVGLIVRIIPNPAKDIGLNILSLFHYAHRP